MFFKTPSGALSEYVYSTRKYIMKHKSNDKLICLCFFLFIFFYFSDPLWIGNELDIYLQYNGHLEKLKMHTVSVAMTRSKFYSIILAKLW